MIRTTDIIISNVRFIASGRDQVETGLLGFVACTLNGSLQLDGLALRKTRAGKFALSFPARTDSAGRHHFYLRPLDSRTRREIERQVFHALGFEMGKTQ